MCVCVCLCVCMRVCVCVYLKVVGIFGAKHHSALKDDAKNEDDHPCQHATSHHIIIIVQYIPSCDIILYFRIYRVLAGMCSVFHFLTEHTSQHTPLQQRQGVLQNTF